MCLHLHPCILLLHPEELREQDRSRLNDTYYLREDFTLMSRILGLGGIDMVGPDVYTRDLEYFIRYIERFSSGDTEENVMHIAEGPGQLYNYGKIVTTCFANNSGYYTYELKSYGGLNFDFGIFRNSATEWIKRDGTKKVMYQWDMLTKVAENITDDITVFNGMVNSVSEQIAACPKNQFKTPRIRALQTESARFFLPMTDITICLLSHRMQHSRLKEKAFQVVFRQERL